MAKEIDKVDLFNDGSVLVSLTDGRNALIDQRDLIAWAQETGAFDKGEELSRDVEQQDGGTVATPPDA
jgi:hypothetical protein